MRKPPNPALRANAIGTADTAAGRWARRLTTTAFLFFLAKGIAWVALGAWLVGP